MDLWDEFYLIMVDDLLNVSVDLISKCVIWKFSEDQSAILYYWVFVGFGCQGRWVTVT